MMDGRRLKSVTGTICWVVWLFSFFEILVVDPKTLFGAVFGEGEGSTKARVMERKLFDDSFQWEERKTR